MDFSQGVPDLEIRHLRLVAAVADEGNLTRAADRLNLTQSALSHQLLDLEERLGTPLFQRLPRKMLLTAAGERVLEAAQRILVELGRTEEDVKQFAENRVGSIRLTTECYTCYHWLPRLLPDFTRRHPRIDIRIDISRTHRPYEALLDGIIDLAIVNTSPNDARIELLPLFSDEMLVITHPDHRFASQEHVTAQDLSEEHLLLHFELEDTYTYRNILRPAGLKPSRVSTVPLTEAIIELVKADMGVAVMARWAVAPQLSSGVLAGVALTPRGLERQWSAATLRNAPRRPYLNDFISMLVDDGERSANQATTPARRKRAS